MLTIENRRFVCFSSIYFFTFLCIPDDVNLSNLSNRYIYKKSNESKNVQDVHKILLLLSLSAGREKKIFKFGRDLAQHLKPFPTYFICAIT